MGRREERALLQLTAHRFDVLHTVDRNVEYQQNFLGLTIAVVVIVARAPLNMLR
jgi:hypothetical protein